MKKVLSLVLCALMASFTFAGDEDHEGWQQADWDGGFDDAREDELYWYGGFLNNIKMSVPRSGWTIEDDCGDEDFVMTCFVCILDNPDNDTIKLGGDSSQTHPYIPTHGIDTIWDDETEFVTPS